MNSRGFALQEKLPELKTILFSEHLVINLLGKLWYEYPEYEFFQKLVAEEVLLEIPFAEKRAEVKAGMEFLSNWTIQNKEGLTKEKFDEIQLDYTRLFVGPDKVIAPPWESIYFNDSRTIFDERTLDVREWYRRFNLESVHIRKEPDNHIGLELAFLAHLAGNAFQALENEDYQQVEELIDAQRLFATEHVFSWVGSLFEIVNSKARTDFYRGIALVTKGVLLELSDILSV